MCRVGGSPPKPVWAAPAWRPRADRCRPTITAPSVRYRLGADGRQEVLPCPRVALRSGDSVRSEHSPRTRDHLRRLQGHRPAAPIHFGPGRNPGTTDHRADSPPASRGDPDDQEHPGVGAVALPRPRRAPWPLSALPAARPRTAPRAPPHARTPARAHPRTARTAHTPALHALHCTHSTALRLSPAANLPASPGGPKVPRVRLWSGPRRHPHHRVIAMRGIHETAPRCRHIGQMPPNHH
jgi:hypothetical protein